MTAQKDHPYLLEWLAKACQYGGGFVSSIARAALVADDENYLIFRPILLEIRQKYPQYEPSEVVREELRGVAADWEHHFGSGGMW